MWDLGGVERVEFAELARILRQRADGPLASNAITGIAGSFAGNRSGPWLDPEANPTEL